MFEKSETPEQRKIRKDAELKKLMQEDARETKYEAVKYKTCLIDPEGKPNVVRENMVQILILYTVTLGFFKITFVEDREFIFWDFWDDYVVNGVFFIDLLLNFFTPIDKGVDIEIEHKKIAYEYIKSWFFLDVLSIMPFELFISSENASDTAESISRLSKIPKILKIVRTAKMLRLARFGRSKNRTILDRVLKYFGSKKSIVG